MPFCQPLEASRYNTVPGVEVLLMPFCQPLEVRSHVVRIAEAEVHGLEAVIA